MAIRPILTLEQPQLRQKSKKVQTFGPPLQRLVDDMLDTMHDEPGIGLAANQIGVMQRLIVVELPEDEEDPQSGRAYAVANPKIVRASRETEEMEEGCLSVPGLVGDVWRSTAITVAGQDVHGKRLRIKARDMLARVFQHEIDHLDGTLFIDRVDDPSRIRPVTPPQEAEPDEAQQPQETIDGLL